MAIFFHQFRLQNETIVYYVCIKYSMCDLICDVITCCVLSCDMGKINASDKITHSHGSAMSVLKATKQVNGKGQNSTPRHTKTP